MSLNGYVFPSWWSMPHENQVVNEICPTLITLSAEEYPDQVRISVGRIGESKTPRIDFEQPNPVHPFTLNPAMTDSTDHCELA